MGYVDEAVYGETLEEKSLGMLVGPLSEEELSARVGPLWLPAYRFGLKQGG